MDTPKDGDKQGRKTTRRGDEKRPSTGQEKSLSSQEGSQSEQTKQNEGFSGSQGLDRDDQVIDTGIGRSGSRETSAEEEASGHEEDVEGLENREEESKGRRHGRPMGGDQGYQGQGQAPGAGA